MATKRSDYQDREHDSKWSDKSSQRDYGENVGRNRGDEDFEKDKGSPGEGGFSGSSNRSEKTGSKTDRSSSGTSEKMGDSLTDKSEHRTSSRSDQNRHDREPS